MSQPTANRGPSDVDDEQSPAPADRHGLGWKSTFLLSCLILGVGAGAVWMIFRTEPTATREGATKQTAMLVEVTVAEAGSFRPTIVATGTVSPAQKIVLRPRVAGEVIERAPGFVPGGIVDQGEVLLQLDPSDYENVLRQRKNELAQAKAELRIEMGRRTVAEQEYELLDENLSEENEALVLREPQLAAARSRVESARAAVEQARLELQRTVIRAPFDAHVLSRAVNVGSQVAAGDRLAQLVGANTYWVETTVPVAKLRWLDFPDGEHGSEVHIRNRSAWSAGAYRTGHLYKLIGSLDDQTRLARVLIAVDDPLAKDAGAEDEPRLMLGSYVETRIRAEPLADVVRLDRDYVRRNDTVWVMQEGQLSIREVDIVFRGHDFAYIRAGIAAGERVVTSDLATIRDGAPLRLKGAASPSKATAGEGARQRAIPTPQVGPPS